MTWKSKFNWQKLSWLKAISVTVPLSQLSILKQLMSCMNSFGDRNVQVWMHGAPLATINPLRENLGSILKHPTAAVTWKLLTPFIPLSPVATGFGKCMSLSQKFQKNNRHLGTGCNYNRSWRSMCFHQAVLSTFQSTSGWRQSVDSCNLPARLTLNVAHTIHAGAKEWYLE